MAVGTPSLRPLMCKYCPRYFDCLSVLKGHQISHEKKYWHNWLHNRKPYMCAICGQRFWYTIEIQDHVEKGHADVVINTTQTGLQITMMEQTLDFHIYGNEGKAYQCIKCNMVLQKGSVKNHAMVHSLDKLYVCAVCHQGFKRIYNLKVHERTHNNNRPYKCKTCRMTFTTSSSLKEHVRLHTGERPYTCDICHMTFRHCSSWRAHEKTHFGEKPFKCQFCGKGFYFNGHLRKHQRNHPTGKHWTCLRCGKSFKDENLQKMHELSHPPQNEMGLPSGVYVCEICGKEYSQYCRLRLHLRNHTNDKPFICSDCGKGFISLGAMTNHERCHSNKRPHECKICKQAFKTIAQYKRHCKIHTGDKPFQCTTCGRRFTEKSGLMYHQRTHTGERPYQCEFCGKSYTTSSSYHRHKRTHTDAAFTCSVCDQTLKNKDSFKIHMRIHNKRQASPQCAECTKITPNSDGEKKGDAKMENKIEAGIWKFHCAICGRSFSQISRFYTHMSSHDDEGPMECLTCGNSFNASSFLQDL